MVTNVNSWEEMLRIYNEMNTQGHNPADVAGDDIDPMQQILMQLDSKDPNPEKIKEALSKLETEMKEMIQVAKEGNLHPVSDPEMISHLLEPTLDSIQKLSSEVGQPGFAHDFSGLEKSMAFIKQDILQG